MESLWQQDGAGAGIDPGTPFVRVAVERGVDTEGGLTYRGAGLAVGDRVEVPLGRGDKPAAGIVVAVGGPELAAGFKPERVKPVLRATGQRLPASLVELGVWLARYYCCPLGLTLAGMTPAAVRAGTGARTRTMLERSGEQPPTDAKLPKAVRAALDALPTVAADAFPIDARELAALLGASNAGPVNKLVALGVLREVEVEEVRSRQADPGLLLGTAAIPDPTPAQQAVIEGVGAALGSFGVHLLRGVTGSGKTEVYLRLIERVLERGQSAIVLVPEISLTPQTAGRFVQRFKDAGVAVLHSGLSAAKRHQQWAAAAAGRARVVVGARSAVFAPVERLGLIVVDEEHASDYKQDQQPRYHARDVAIKRAQLEGAGVLLGSATPSLESWANAQAGRSRLWELPQRVGGGALPRVRIVDLAAERRAAGELSRGAKRELRLLGPTLADALETTLRRGGQAILMLNRRGFASYLCCRDARCGWSLSCDACDAAMVLHRASSRRGGYVRCHHCLAERLVPRTCPVCGQGVIELGAGTQRAEAELAERFGGSLGLVEGEALARVDSDTVRSAADWFSVLEKFRAGELKVLLGTQMIAKGHDFPNVRLVGVLNADTGLGMNDFRAAERTFQLVAQVAGRAGRADAEGVVIVQTMAPDEPAIQAAARHDYVGFAERELRIRDSGGLPPTRRMVRIVCRDESAEKAEARAGELADLLRGFAALEVHGPIPCEIARISEKFRFAVEALAGQAGTLAAALSDLRRRGLVRSDAATAVDVDPIAML
jgi:primosomal protein N' (replication factor Y)